MIVIFSCIAWCLYDIDISAPRAGLSNQAVPEDKQAQFQHTYTVLIAFLSAILPPIITQGVNHVPSTAQETALGTVDDFHSTATSRAFGFR